MNKTRIVKFLNSFKLGLPSVKNILELLILGQLNSIKVFNYLVKDLLAQVIKAEIHQFQK